MEHVAIDLGGRESQICVRAGDGTITHETRINTRELPRFLAGLPKSRVVLETCAESFTVADAARLSGHDVRVVPATLAPMLGVGARKTKTDRRDSRVLSEASCRIELPSVHIPTTESRDRKTMLSMHDVLVQSRTAMVNAVRGWMRTQLVRCRSGAVETFTTRMRQAFEGQVVEAHIERVLASIDALSQQIRASEREIEQAAKADARSRQLMTMPGVGPMTSLAFVSTLDDISRFENAHKVEAYLGLTPGERSSSDRQQRLSITKAGPTRLRWLLVQAAWAARRSAPAAPMVVWSLQVEKRRGKRMALVALARKMAGVLFAMWRDRKPYDPTKGARTSTL
jgi:transposase